MTLCRFVCWAAAFVCSYRRQVLTSFPSCIKPRSSVDHLYEGQSRHDGRMFRQVHCVFGICYSFKIKNPDIRLRRASLRSQKLCLPHAAQPLMSQHRPRGRASGRLYYLSRHEESITSIRLKARLLLRFAHFGLSGAGTGLGFRRSVPTPLTHSRSLMPHFVIMTHSPSTA